MAQTPPPSILVNSVRIAIPTLTKSDPGNFHKTDVMFTNRLKAAVMLQRNNDTLSVTLTIITNHGCSSCSSSSSLTFDTMHITPVYKPTVAVSNKVVQGQFKCDIKHSYVQHDDKYEFDITLQKGNDFPVVKTNLPDSSINFAQIMNSLLMDVHSVDVCLLFESEVNYPSIGLWAHRLILSRYKKFDELIRVAIKQQDPPTSKVKTDVESVTSDSTLTSNDGKSDRPVIRISGFSLATISVLLRYIYTGEIVLRVDLKNHVLSSFKAMIVTQDEKGEKQEIPINPVSYWKSESVSWEELLEAASYYGVASLQEKSEEAVIETIDESTVMNALFNSGMSSSKVKEAALNFIVENMTEMVTKGDNPFNLFKDHPDCHDYMFEIMRRCTKLA
ncbi:hypothetical protein BGZ76_000615 [Entomortierella beljakovae]|nr:hypothetical protein BGZ76_000615 [Entomortierella beljakovae]